MTARRYTLGELLARLPRPARYAIAARPEDPVDPVTTAVVWPCGCRASGPSYRELTLEPCAAHAAPELRST